MFVEKFRHYYSAGSIRSGRNFFAKESHFKQFEKVLPHFDTYENEFWNFRTTILTLTAIVCSMFAEYKPVNVPQQGLFAYF